VFCMAPLWLGGIREKKSTPSIGLEVPVKSRLLASGSKEETPTVEENIKKISSTSQTMATVFIEI